MTIDPNPCNALTDAGAGLLVPQVQVIGVAPGGAQGPNNSVDIIVTDNPGDCPDVKTISAQLTPANGIVTPGAGETPVAPGAGGTGPLPGSTFVLPETGCYSITLDSFGHLQWINAVAGANDQVVTYLRHNGVRRLETGRSGAQANWNGPTQDLEVRNDVSATTIVCGVAGDTIDVVGDRTCGPNCADTGNVGIRNITWVKISD